MHVRTAHELQLMLSNYKHDIWYMHVREVKSKSRLFWNHTSSTLGHCSLIPSDDWLTTRWVDQEKNKHCHRLCHSVPVCWLPTVHFRLRSDTLSQPFSPSTFLSPRSHEDHCCHGDDVRDDGARRPEAAERFQSAEGEIDRFTHTHTFSFLYCLFIMFI